MQLSTSTSSTDFRTDELRNAIVEWEEERRRNYYQVERAVEVTVTIGGVDGQNETLENYG